ncbi:MAG: TldD/PmbA family protein [Candidatus Coatesbacteria bacterium]|nr:TldD/PmbA family protein [Candidatus Coatesbacteria bacterium]
MSDLKKYDLSVFDCEYLDVRLEETMTSRILFRNYILEDISTENQKAFFIRVWNNGRWLYASVAEEGRLEKVINDLIEQSRKYKDTEKKHYIPSKSLSQELIFNERNKPDYIELVEKRDLLGSYQEIFRNRKEVASLDARYMDFYNVKSFASSSGIYFKYDRVFYGMMFNFVLKDEDKIFITKFSSGGVLYSDLFGKDKEITGYLDEAVPFLYAGEVKKGIYPVVLDEIVSGVFAHESFGHKSEADFMTGDPEALKEWEIGKKVGSSILSIVDQGDILDSSGFTPFDDEGTKATKTYLIKNGILQGRLHSNDTARDFEEKPTGNSRAMNGEFEPIVRMTNTYIEAGQSSFEDLISDIKEGVFIKNINYGTGMSTFTIAPNMSYMIRDGRIAEPVRVSVATGNVFETLGLIVGLSDKVRMEVRLFGGCGKMEQWPLPVGLGGPKVKVSKMQIA